MRKLFPVLAVFLLLPALGKGQQVTPLAFDPQDATEAARANHADKIKAKYQGKLVEAQGLLWGFRANNEKKCYLYSLKIAFKPDYGEIEDAREEQVYIAVYFGKNMPELRKKEVCDGGVTLTVRGRASVPPPSSEEGNLHVLILDNAELLGSIPVKKK